MADAGQAHVPYVAHRSRTGGPASRAPRRGWERDTTPTPRR